MKVTSSLQTASQWLAVRLYTRGSSRADRQRGASALEYIMLAAVIVGLLLAVGAFFGGEGGNPILTFFQDLFSKAEDPLKSTP
jgi:pilus assembly protein Flp/PilA